MFIGEAIMKNKQKNRYRPCSARCFGVCLLSFMLSFIFIGISIEARFLGDSSVDLWIGLGFLIFNIVLVIFSVFKWNSFVHIDGEKLRQKQFGKNKIFYYGEITDIKMSMIALTRGPWLIIVKKHEDKITFEITSEVYEKFRELCTNKEIMEKLNKALNDRNLD